MRKVIDRYSQLESLYKQPFSRPIDFNNNYTPVENTVGKYDWYKKYTPLNYCERVSTTRTSQNSKNRTI